MPVIELLDCHCHCLLPDYPSTRLGGHWGWAYVPLTAGSWGLAHSKCSTNAV